MPPKVNNAQTKQNNKSNKQAKPNQQVIRSQANSNYYNKRFKTNVQTKTNKNFINNKHNKLNR